MVDYLLRSGAPPSYFDMPDVNQNARERREAYVTSMRERGVEPRIFPVSSLDWNFERLAFEEAMRLLKAGVAMGETILCANDRVAFGVLAAINETGARIGIEPDCDYRVAGHDNQPLSAYTWPPLTTVSQDVDRMGRLALNLLLVLQIAGVPLPGFAAAG